MSIEKENWWERIEKGEPWWSRPWPEKFEKFEPYPTALSLNLEDYIWEGSCCMGCAMCLYIEFCYATEAGKLARRCPSREYGIFDIYSCVGKMKVIPQVMQTAELEITPTLQKAAFHCMLCGACDVGCKCYNELEPLLGLESLRIRCAEEMEVMTQFVPITENITTKSNFFGREPKERLKWLPKEVKSVKKADVLYFVGCCSSYVNTEIAQATARILTTAGINFMILDDERCCGKLIYNSGQLDKAKSWAEGNLKQIRESGAKTVVCSCAECYHMLKVEIPKMLEIATADLGFEVVHLVELVNRLVSEGKLKLEGRVDLEVTLHDSCNLARKSEPWVPWKGRRGMFGYREPEPPLRKGTNGVYFPQREILNAIPGIELVEMVRVRENAWCCGGGGGVREAFPDLTAYASDERIEEADRTGAKAIVAACPRCKRNFAAAVERKRGSIAEVYDISELIVKSIGG